MSMRAKVVLTILSVVCATVFEFWLFGALTMTPEEMVSKTSIWTNSPQVRMLGFVGIIVLILACTAIWYYEPIKERFHKSSKIRESPFRGKPRELIRSMFGNATMRGGIYVLHSGNRIFTNELFKPPVTFQLIAKTDSDNLRFAYGVDQFIFNWSDNKDELRVDGGPISGQHQPKAGRIPVDEWVAFDVVANKYSLSIAVNGKERHCWKADFSSTNQPFCIPLDEARITSIISLKSLLIGEPICVFLADLSEQDVVVGYGSFGKYGNLGYQGAKGRNVNVNNSRPPYALSMHPPSNGSSHVSYQLSKRFTNLSSAAFINDDKPSQTRLTFKVIGDDKLLWHTALQTNESPIPFSVDVAGVNNLELEVECAGPYNDAHAVWIDPALI